MIYRKTTLFIINLQYATFLFYSYIGYNHKNRDISHEMPLTALCRIDMALTLIEGRYYCHHRWSFFLRKNK